MVNQLRHDETARGAGKAVGSVQYRKSEQCQASGAAAVRIIG